MVKNYYAIENYKSLHSLSYLTRRVAKLTTLQLESLFAVHDFTFVQYAILMNIHEGVAITASDICQKISHDIGALTRLLEILEQRGFIARTRSETDRRRVEMELTPAGREKLGQLIEIVVGFWNEFLLDFTREEADMMTDVLNRMMNKLSAPAKEQAKDALKERA